LAKKSDHLAGLEAEDTGGLFSSLLAEEDAADRRRMLWRAASWGALSVAAVTAAVMASQSSLGWRREQAATADLVQQANRLQAVARESEKEARRLASAVETLNSDRDRLYTRVTVLEQGLESVTGAIAKQTAAATATAAPVPAQPDAQPAVPATISSVAALGPLAPLATVASKPASQPEKATATASVEPAPANTSPVKEVATKPASTPTAAATPPTPLVETKSMMAPPDPAAGKLIEASKPLNSVAAEPILPVVAAAPPGESEQETADVVLPKIQRTEFGVDVGSANSISGLRALWRGLLKSRANAPLAALQPIIVIREGAGGRGLQLRLVAGPLGDAAAAAKICAVLTENDRSCETAVYDGQRLSLKSDDAPAAAKPEPPAATARKRSAPQRRASVEEPKKPEQQATTSPSLRSFFSGKKN
jgi:hypothetical protein